MPRTTKGGEASCRTSHCPSAAYFILVAVDISGLRLALTRLLRGRNEDDFVGKLHDMCFRACVLACTAFIAQPCRFCANNLRNCMQRTTTRDGELMDITACSRSEVPPLADIAREDLRTKKTHHERPPFGAEGKNPGVFNRCWFRFAAS